VHTLPTRGQGAKPRNILNGNQKIGALPQAAPRWHMGTPAAPTRLQPATCARLTPGRLALPGEHRRRMPPCGGSLSHCRPASLAPGNERTSRSVSCSGPRAAGLQAARPLWADTRHTRGPHAAAQAPGAGLQAACAAGGELGGRTSASTRCRSSTRNGLQMNSSMPTSRPLSCMTCRAHSLPISKVRQTATRSVTQLPA